MGMQPAAVPMEMEMTIWKNFMTMPTTAMGIWAYCSWPKISSRMPYFCTMLLMAAMAATSEICARKLQMPSARKRRIRRADRWKLPFSSLTDFRWSRYHTASAAVRI